MSVNKVILVGNLGRDPDIKYFEDGTKIVTASLATSRKWKSQAGEQKEQTAWHRVQFFGALAEIADNLKKGSKIYVEGEIQYQEWEKDGEKRYSTSIRAFNFQFLSPKDQPLVDDSIPF